MVSDVAGAIRDDMLMSGALGLRAKPFSRMKLLQALAEFLLWDAETGVTVFESDSVEFLRMRYFHSFYRTCFG